MLRFFHRTWLFLAILSFGSAFIPPKSLLLAGAWTFTIPIFGVGLLVFLLVYALRKEKRPLVYTFFVFLLGTPYWLATVNFSLPADVSEEDLKALSYNVRYFSSIDHLRFESTRREAFLTFVQGEQPDLICLQEFYDPNRWLSKQLHKEGYTEQKFLWIRRGHGLAIFSRFPVTAYQAMAFDNSPQNGFQQVDVRSKRGKLLRLTNVHLESFRLSGFGSMHLEKVVDLVFVLGQGMIRQGEQVEWLLSKNKSKAIPILICGDYNSTPYSYVYQRLRGELQSAFEEKGNGFGITYRGKLPFLRIDHHFYSEQLTLHAFRVASEVQISDHLPLIGVYRL